MDWTILISAVITVSSAVVSATLVYVFGVRSTRKGKLYDVKLEAYSSVADSMLETTMSIETNMRLLAIVATPNKTTPAGAARILEELVKLGDIESLSQMADPQTTEAIQSGDTKVLGRYLMRAMILSNRRMADHLMKLNSLYARIDIIGPSPEIERCIKAAQVEIRNGQRTVVRYSEGLRPEMTEVPDEFGEGKIYSTPEEWRTSASKAIEAMIDSMVRDLKDTL